MDVRKLRAELSDLPDICKVFLVVDGRRVELSDVCHEISSKWGGRVVLYAEHAEDEYTGDDND